MESDRQEVSARGYNLGNKNPPTKAHDHGDPESPLANLNAAAAETARLRDQWKSILAEARACWLNGCSHNPTASPTRSCVCAAFFLDPAMRGKFVPQDPADKPGAEILKRFTAGKAGK